MFCGTDGNLVGLMSIGTVSGLPSYPYRVLWMTVTLDVSGGLNGYLYAYLVGPDETDDTCEFAGFGRG